MKKKLPKTLTNKLRKKFPITNPVSIDSRQFWLPFCQPLEEIVQNSETHSTKLPFLTTLFTHCCECSLIFSSMFNSHVTTAVKPQLKNANKIQYKHGEKRNLDPARI